MNPATDASKRTRRKSQILIVDDHALVRYALAGLINQQDDLAVCGEASDAAAASTILASKKADLALVDLILGSSHGLQLIKNLKAQQPGLKILVISMHEESIFAESALRAGASGYIMKEISVSGVLAAIRKVLNGEICVSEKFSESLLQRHFQAQSLDSPLEALSDREREVLQLIGQWHSTRQISEQLHLSIKTIDHYREQIKKKLNLKSANELVQFAVLMLSSHQKQTVKVNPHPAPKATSPGPQ